MGDEPQRVIEALFDRIGDGEWDQLEADTAARASQEIHRRFMARHLPVGRTLEIGAGAGRFTIDLARSGRRVVVGDLSECNSN